MYENMKSRYDELRKEILWTQGRLASLPEGRLQISRNGRYEKLFMKQEDDGGTCRRVYLSRKKKQLAKELAEKEYLIRKLSDLKKEKAALEAFFRNYKNANQSRLFVERSKALKSLLPAACRPLADTLSEWSASPFDSTASHPESLIVKAPNGMVRSKSESIIAWELFENGIPYRYECDFPTPEGILHPDFTIRHPATGAFFLWEHFGLMDDPAYVRSALNKIQTYIGCGYLPTVDLIMTFESVSHPLDPGYVRCLIRHYFPQQTG